MSLRKEEKYTNNKSNKIWRLVWYKFTYIIVAACKEEHKEFQVEPRLSKKWNGLGWGLMEEEDLSDWGAGKGI